MTVWQELASNQVLISSVVGWTVAQLLKTIIEVIINKEFNPERLVGSGGMPSSHSATVCALTVAAGLRYGLSSFEFAVCFILASVVMYDAMGVRRETGKQAKILNTILFDKQLFDDILTFDGDIITERLKEYVGHTPIQVLAGAVLGIIIALVMDPLFG